MIYLESYCSRLAPAPRDTARVIVLDSKRRVLLARRGAGETNAGKWHIPGGVKEPDEYIFETGKREIHEEFGLDIDPIFFIKYLSGSQSYIVNCYYAFVEAQEPQLLSPENEEWDWFAEDEIPEAGYFDNFVLSLFFYYLRREELIVRQEGQLSSI